MDFVKHKSWYWLNSVRSAIGLILIWFIPKLLFGQDTLKGSGAGNSQPRLTLSVGLGIGTHTFGNVTFDPATQYEGKVSAVSTPTTLSSQIFVGLNRRLTDHWHLIFEEQTMFRKQELSFVQIGVDITDNVVIESKVSSFAFMTGPQWVSQCNKTNFFASVCGGYQRLAKGRDYIEYRNKIYYDASNRFWGPNWQISAGLNKAIAGKLKIQGELFAQSLGYGRHSLVNRNIQLVSFKGVSYMVGVRLSANFVLRK